MLGKPAAVVDPDTLDLPEWRQHVQPLPQMMAELAEALWSMPMRAVADMVQTAQPFVQQMMREELTAPPPQRDPEDDEASPDEAGEQARAEATANGRAQPSANGVRRPMGAVPRWLDKIAGHARMAGVRERYSRRGSG